MRVLEASETTTAEGPEWCEVAAEEEKGDDEDKDNNDEDEEEQEEDKQSATARRSGSGGFLSDEDLSRETPPAPPSCSRELPGLRDGLKLEDMDFEVHGISVNLTVSLLKSLPRFI